MKDKLDKLISVQVTQLNNHKQSSFLVRNKKLFVIILVILVGLWIFTVVYTYYWLPRIFKMRTQ